ncbi:MAG: DUF2079 domain-containing protein [Candidatus Omnitrophica bacterium]|nr:DUF2079 domain-containing protein [Candidatus Omnitrophota bacterium]MDD5671056.1 DUF2079 domain-containing protein [Candidatus Omnitrophota bacterium]
MKNSHNPNCPACQGVSGHDAGAQSQPKFLQRWLRLMAVDPRPESPGTVAHLARWNFLAFAVAFAGLFYLLTNGIPLAQWGWIDTVFNKKICVKTMRNVLLPVFAVFAIWAWRWPWVFRQLTVTRWVKKFFQAPLWPAVSVLFVFYVAVMVTVGWARHLAMETRAFDLGIFAQAVWSTTQGDFLFSSIKENICLLGDHVSPLLAVLAPLYSIWPDPRNLVVIQAIAAGSCLFPIAYLAHEKTKTPAIAIAFALMYCFYLPTRAALHEDFHPEVLVEVFMMLAFIFLEKRRLWLFVLSLLVVVSAKESFFGISFMFGFYALVFKRLRLLGTVLMVASVALFWFEVAWVVPYFSKALYLYRGNYDGLLVNPVGELTRRLLHPDAIEYFFQIYGPFLLLPFFHLPTLLLTFPVLFQNMISENPVMRSFGYHYTTGLTPFVFIASIYGFAVVCDKIFWIGKRKMILALVVLGVILLRSAPAEYFYLTDILSHKTPHTDMVRAQLAQIPSAATVLTHNSFIPQMCNRKRIYQFDYNPTTTKAQQAGKYKADYVIYDRAVWEPNTAPLELSLKQLLDAGYELVYQKEDFYIMRKSA